MTTLFDSRSFNPTNVRMTLLRQTVSGPVAPDGQQVVVSTPGGLWEIAFTGIPVNTRARLLAWRAFVAQADGGEAEFDVRIGDRRQAPWPLDGAGQAIDTPGGIGVTLTSAAALDATTALLTQSSGGALTAGQHFSLTGTRWGKRLYRLSGVTSLGGGAWSTTIRTGLREDIGAGAALDFETPSVVARVANPLEIEPTLEMQRRGFASVTFIESFQNPVSVTF